MLRQRLEELTKSFKRRTDPSKEDEEDRSRSEADNKVVKILKLIKNDETDERVDFLKENSERELELVKLVQDFHKQYQLLYAHNIHLQDKLKKNFHDRVEDGPPSSTYSSDSEYFSSEEVENHNVQFDNDHREVADSSSDWDPRYANLNNVLGIKACEQGGKILCCTNEHGFHESQASIQIKELEQRIAVIETELESLRRQKRDLEATIESKDIMTKQLEEENTGLHAQISDLQCSFEQKENEMSSLLRKLEDNEKKLVSKLAKSMGQASSLQLELDSLHAQKRKLEEMMVRENNEAASQIKGLMEQLNSTSKKLESLANENFELESQLDQKTKDYGSLVNDNFEVMALTPRVQILQHEVEILQEQKSQLQFQIEEKKKEFQQCVTDMENQNTNLIRNVMDEQRMLKNEQYSVDKLREENKQTVVRTSRLKINWNPQTAERKMEELAEEFHKKMEDNIRLLCQRILVAEQLHMENKDSYRKMKGQIKQESQALEVKLANYQDDLRKLKDMSETAKDVLSVLDLVARKFEDSEKFTSRIAGLAIEIQNAEGWVKRTNEEVNRLKNNADSLHEQLDEKEEQEFLLRQKVWNLEEKVSMDEKEKLKTMRGLSQLEMRVEELEGMIRQKNEQLSDLGEEKREAIRQLCLLIDYHQGRYNHLRKAIIRNLSDHS